MVITIVPLHHFKFFDIRLLCLVSYLIVISCSAISFCSFWGCKGGYDNMKSFELGGHFHSKIEGVLYMSLQIHK